MLAKMAARFKDPTTVRGSHRLYGHDPRLFQTTIKRLITDENNHLTAAETVRLEPYIDPVNGARDMKEIPGSEEILPCEMILIAAGFKGANDYVAQAFGLDSTARHTVATAPNGYQTANPQIFCRRRYAPRTVPGRLGYRPRAESAPKKSTAI